MLLAIEKNLKRGIYLLEIISNKDYVDTSVAPYYSSIGGHIRHVLDIFDCIFEGIGSKSVDLSARKRNLLVEQHTTHGIAYFNEIIQKLKTVENLDMNTIVKVTDDLGTGFLTVDYTLASALIQAHSHAIHHFASIGYMISQLGIQLPDEDFGFNPTTPKSVVND